MENICREKTFTSSIPYFSLILEKEGIKAAKNEPSIKTFRNKFVSLNAAKNTSASIPVPTIFAMRISLIKPDIREIIVKNETRNVERKIFITEKGVDV